MENKNMTAVEWLEQKLKDRYSLIHSQPLFEQAKQMEEEREKELHISDVSSRAYRIAKAREVYENISSLYDTFDAVGNDDLQEAKTLITNYILKLEQC